ncbi:MAG: hypothetical protein HN348_26755 [Proteobacteria bacterium]|nr:hypothetical protein [Pseudomonadota bacterium]
MPAAAPVPTGRPTAAAAPTPTAAPVPAAAPVATSAPTGGAPGQIQVTTMAAVQAILDGVPMTFNTVQGYVAWSVRPGNHSLQIKNMLNKEMANVTVTVPAGKRVRYEYKKKSLTKLGVVNTSARPAEPAPEPAPAAPPPPPGSLQITGLSAYEATVWVNGGQVGFSNGTNSFVKGGLQAGTYNIRVEGQNQVLYEGPMEVQSGQNHRCMAEYKNFQWQLNCHWTQPAMN